jgi:outer membrane protein W
MRIAILLAFSATLFGLQETHADTLLLVQEAQENAKSDEDAKKADAAPNLYRDGWYMRAEIGANFTSPVGLRNNDVEINLHPGMDLGLAFGYRFTKNWGVEVQTGGVWNSVKNQVQGNRTDDLGGDIYQIPVVANVVLTLPLSDGEYEPLFGRGAEFLTYLGFGGQYIYSEISDSPDSYNDDGWVFRYQLGLALNAQLAPNVKTGIYGRISRTSALEANGNFPGYDAFNNYAVGISVDVRF